MLKKHGDSQKLECIHSLPSFWTPTNHSRTPLGWTRHRSLGGPPIELHLWIASVEDKSYDGWAQEIHMIAGLTSFKTLKGLGILYLLLCYRAFNQKTSIFIIFKVMGIENIENTTSSATKSSEHIRRLLANKHIFTFDGQWIICLLCVGTTWMIMSNCRINQKCFMHAYIHTLLHYHTIPYHTIPYHTIP